LSLVLEKPKGRRGHRPPPARLEKGPHRPGRARRKSIARQASPGAIPGRLSPSRLPAEKDRLQDKGRFPGPRRPATRGAVCQRRGMAQGKEIVIAAHPFFAGRKAMLGAWRAAREM